MPTRHPLGAGEYDRQADGLPVVRLRTDSLRGLRGSRVVSVPVLAWVPCLDMHQRPGIYLDAPGAQAYGGATLGDGRYVTLIQPPALVSRAIHWRQSAIRFQCVS